MRSTPSPRTSAWAARPAKERTRTATKPMIRERRMAFAEVNRAGDSARMRRKYEALCALIPCLARCGRSAGMAHQRLTGGDVAHVDRMGGRPVITDDVGVLRPPGHARLLTAQN